MYARNGQRRPLLPPYRTQQSKLRAVGGSMQNVSPLAYTSPRRSSATASGVAMPTNTNAINNKNQQFRSQSMDGLLSEGINEAKIANSNEKRIAEAAALVAAGSSALTQANCSSNNISESIESMVQKREKNGELSAADKATATQHRKSRSLDHFFVQQQTLANCTPNATDGTQSMQNLALNAAATDLNRGVRTTATPARLEALRRHAATTRQSPEGLSSAEDEQEDIQQQQQQQQQHHPKTTTATTNCSKIS